MSKSVDPTKPFYSKGVGKNATKHISKYALQSIIANGQQKHVVINGKLMALGDRIGPYTLTVITQQYAVLTSAEKELKMSIFSSIVTN